MQFVETEYGSLKMGPQRARFLIESVTALRQNLQNIGSNLLVGVGDPAEILTRLVSRGSSEVKTSDECRETTVLWQEQATALELEVDARVREAMEALPGGGPTLATLWRGSLYSRHSLPFAHNLSDVPDTFKGFKKKVDASAGDWRTQVEQMAETPRRGQASLTLPHCSHMSQPIVPVHHRMILLNLTAAAAAVQQACAQGGVT